jgi:hypothetical protein
MSEVITKSKEPRGGEVFQKTAEEKELLKKLKADYRKKQLKNESKA